MLAHLSHPLCVVPSLAVAPGSPKVPASNLKAGPLPVVVVVVAAGKTRAHFTFTCCALPGLSRSNVTVPSREEHGPVLQGQGTVVPPLPEHQARADLPSLDPSERVFEPQKARRAPRAPFAD